MNEPIPETHYHEAADAVRQRLEQIPTTGLILGSGLGPLVEEIQSPTAIPFQDIPHWPHSTVVAGQILANAADCTPSGRKKYTTVRLNSDANWRNRCSSRLTQA